jgi:hypothetical protein
MRIFVPKDFKNKKNQYTPSRSSMVKNLKKAGFSDGLLKEKTYNELIQMTNRFIASRHNPGSVSGGKLKTRRGWTN